MLKIKPRQEPPDFAQLWRSRADLHTSCTYMYWLGLGSFIDVGSPVKITQQWKSSLRLGGYMHNSKRSRFSKIQNCYRFFYLGMSWNSITCLLSLTSFNWHENIASARSKIIYELDNNLTRIAVFCMSFQPFSGYSLWNLISLVSNCKAVYSRTIMCDHLS